MLGSAIAITMPLKNMSVKLMRHLDLLTVSGEVHGMKQQARIINLFFLISELKQDLSRINLEATDKAWIPTACVFLQSAHLLC